MKSLYKQFLAIFLVLALFGVSSPAQQIPVGQSAGSAVDSAEREKKQEKVKTRLLKSVEEPVIGGGEEVIPEREGMAAGNADYKIRIDRIVVEGVTKLTRKEIDSIVSPYEGSVLSLSDFREITDEITAAYKRKGNVTALAYLVPQKIENNTLRIAVAEGLIGDVNIRGNKFFSTRLLQNYIDLRRGDVLNYDALRENLNYINENPDRNASAVLEKGSGQNETNVNVNVKDRFPWHLTLSYNNYNSRYLGKNKYMGEIKCNNFLGMDHKASGEFQIGEDGKYQLYSGRYLMPITKSDKLGAYYIHLNQELGREVSRLNIKGDGDIASLYWTHRLINTENLTINVNPAFEYKDITNKVLGIVLSRDNMRIAKLGFDIDYMDMFGGRNIITQEFGWGIPDMLGGLDSKDPKASRVNTGSKFFKSVTNAARIQILPWDLTLMMRGAMQLTPDNLASSEQFTVGGPTSVRGYPVAEFSGDRAYTSSSELYIPPYFVPKDWEVPFTDTTVYDSLRLVAFFDWGMTEIKTPQVGEEKREVIYSVGPALRFNIPEKMSISFDYGFGLGQKASDGSKSRGYVEVKLFF